jgi:hypothetical protein
MTPVLAIVVRQVMYVISVSNHTIEMIDITSTKAICDYWFESFCVRSHPETIVISDPTAAESTPSQAGSSHISPPNGSGLMGAEN